MLQPKKNLDKALLTSSISGSLILSIKLSSFIPFFSCRDRLSNFELIGCFGKDWMPVEVEGKDEDVDGKDHVETEDSPDA